LHALVTHALGQDVMTGDYFVFFNRRRHRCKILYWDRDGLVVWAKRLERGRFQLPAACNGAVSVEVDGTTLAMILGGVDLQSVQRRKRYQVPSRDRRTVDVN
jgi:transposase